MNEQQAVEKFKLHELRNMTNWKEAIIVFSNESWKRDYSLESRSYKISNDNKYFGNYLGNSLFGYALDGSDDGVRLDHYLDRWVIEYCYITEYKEEVSK